MKTGRNIALVLVVLLIPLVDLQPAQIAHAQAQVGSLTLASDEGHIGSSVIDPMHGFAYFGTQTGVVVKINLSDFTRVGGLNVGLSLTTAVIDSQAGFAYFGTSACVYRCSGDSVVKVRLSNFTEVGALTLGQDEHGLSSSVIDTAAGFAYFGTSPGSPSQGKIVKIRLADFTEVGSVAAYSSLTSAVIDSAGNFAYFGASANEIVKLRLADFTVVGSLLLNPGETDLTSSVIDSAAGFAYFGTYRTPGIIVKIRLSDYTEVGSMTLNSGGDYLSSATIDPAKGFAYFTTHPCINTSTTAGATIKLRLSDFTRNDTLSLGAAQGCPAASVIDPAAGFAYLGTDHSPSFVEKIRLSDFTNLGAIVLDPGEDNPSSSVIDPRGGYAYFSTHYIPGVIAKIRLSNFTEAASLILPGCCVGTSVIDSAAGFAYFATAGNPGTILKVRLSNFTQAGSLTLKTDECCMITSVIDSAAGFAYFGAANVTWSGVAGYPLIVKVRLSDFTENATLILPSSYGGLDSSAIDPTAGFAYFGAGTDPGIVLKIDLASFTLAGTITLNPGENALLSAAIDPSAGFAYFGTISYVAVKIRLSDFTRVGALTFDSSDFPLATATIDPTAGFLYFGTQHGLVKVRLSDFTIADSITLHPTPERTSVIDPLAGFLYLGTGTLPGVVIKVDLNAPPPPPIDYTLSNSGDIKAEQNSSGNTTITATFMGGTAQAITLYCIGFIPAGASCSFSPVSITPTGSSVLTISTTSATPLGNYTVHVTGSPLGDTTMETSLNLAVTNTTVTPPTGSSAPTTIFGLDPTIFYAIVGGVAILTASFVTIEALRRRKRIPSSSK